MWRRVPGMSAGRCAATGISSVWLKMPRDSRRGPLNEELGQEEGHEVHEQGRNHLADAHRGLHRRRDRRPQRPGGGGGEEGDREDQEGGRAGEEERDGDAGERSRVELSLGADVEDVRLEGERDGQARQEQGGGPDQGEGDEAVPRAEGAPGEGGEDLAGRVAPKGEEPGRDGHGGQEGGGGGGGGAGATLASARGAGRRGGHDPSPASRVPALSISSPMAATVRLSGGTGINRPRTMTTTRSASSRISSRSAEISTTPGGRSPVLVNPAIRARTARVAFTSSPRVGDSATRRSRARRNSRPVTTFCWFPPERVPATSPGRPAPHVHLAPRERRPSSRSLPSPATDPCGATPPGAARMPRSR